MLNVFELAASITLDKSKFDKGLDEAKGSATSFGTIFGANLASDAVQKGFQFIANGTKTVASGIAGLVKQSTEAYSNYEQMTGGVEKLYGDAASKVEKYANEAYKTAGMNANDYMNTATQFSASLIKSLNGDVNAAADMTDVAMRSMSDNVNVFGSNMEDVQNAYKGFSRENYTMLDNLKLGYSGTKEGMEQLVKDAASYKDEQKELNETVDAGSMSFANIVKAIDVVQKHQGIAGTTAKEAATTVEGSLNMVKSAWDNVVTAIGTGKGLDTAINDLITSLIGDGSGKGGLINNIMPVIQRSMEGIGKLISESAPIIAKYLPGLIETLIPPVVQSIATLAAAIIADIPVIAKAIWDAFGKSINDLAKKYPLFGKIVSGIKTALDILLPILKGAIPIVAAFVAAFAFVKIASGIATFISTIQNVVSGIGMFITAIKSASSVFALLQGIFIANPFGLIVAGIMAAVAAGVLLYQNWDKIKAGAGKLWETIKGTFSKIGHHITSSLKNAYEQSTKMTSSFLSDMQQAYDESGGGLAGAFSALSQGYRDAIDMVVQAFGKLTGIDVSGFMEKFNTVWRVASNAVETFLSAIQNAFLAVVKFFKDLPGNIAEFVTSIPEKLGSLASSIGAWAAEAIPTIINNIVQFFAELPSKIGYVLGLGIGTIANWGVQLFQWAVTTIPQVIAAIVQFFAELPGKIWTWLTATIQRIGEWGVNLGAKALEIGATFLTNVVKFFVQLPGNIWKWVTNAFQKVVAWGAQMGPKATSIGTTFLTNVVKFFIQLPGKIWTHLNNALGKVADFAGKLWSKGTEAGKKFASNLIDEVKGLPKKFFDIGVDIVKGIWNGIQSVGKWIKDQIGGFFGGIVQGVKDGLGIHSPSKVFAGIGEMMARGLGVGWDDQYGAIQKQIQSGLNFDAGRITGSFGVTESSTSNDANQKLDDLSALLQEWLPQMANMQMVMDSGETVGALAPKMTTAISRRLTTKYR